MSPRLLETKFHIPAWKPEGVSRPRLLEKLQTGLSEKKKLTLISAPPGYGKTTLLEEWIHSLPNNDHVAWLSLDQVDNDPAHFLLYFLTALQRIDNDLGQGALSLLGIPQMPPLIAFFDELINDLSLKENNFMLILDDYHVISNSEIHKGVEYFIEHQPSSFHLVITTREDPPLSLARLRANNMLTEIRARDLQFAVDEATIFFNHSMRLSLPPDAIQIIITRTEGWAVGLQLAALAMKNVSDQQDFLADFSGSHRYIVDYLLDEVLKQQPPEIREFLEKTAVLNRFNADLCLAVTGNTNSAEILFQLEKSNLFLIPLDDQRGWYRYHHLFGDVLQASFSANEKSKLLTNAAIWFESQGLVAEAISSWLAVKSFESAARLIGCLVPDLIRTGELQTLLGWLNALPDEIILQDSELVSYKTLALLMTGQINLAMEFADHAFQKSPKQGKINRPGRLLAMQSLIASLVGRGDPGKLAREALEQIEEDDLIFRALALISIGNSCSWEANLQASSQAFRESWELGRRMNHPFVAFIALTNLVFNLQDMGRLREAESLCRAALADHVDNRGRHLPIAAILYSPLACICFEKGDFEEAKKLAKDGLATCQRLALHNIMGGELEITLARVAFEEHHVQEAVDLLINTAEIARANGMAIIIYKITVVQLDLYLLMGKLSDAKIKLDELKALAHSDLWNPDPVLEYFSLRYQAAVGPSEKELSSLDELEKDSLRRDYIKRAMYAEIYKAIILQQNNRLTEARQSIESALQKAAPEGYLSLFYPHPGRPTLPVLELVRTAAPDFVERILKNSQPAILPSSLKSQLPDPLSEQEMRVLKLIMAGKSNQEIADILVISVGTAKWHVHNILRKLDVNNRPQAIARALELGLEP